MLNYFLCLPWRPRKLLKGGSVSAPSHIHFCGSMCYREVRKEDVGGQRDRGCAPAIGTVDQGRGPDDCRADIGCGPRSCGQYKVVMEGAEHDRSQFFF